MCGGDVGDKEVVGMAISIFGAIMFDVNRTEVGEAVER